VENSGSQRIHSPKKIMFRGLFEHAIDNKGRTSFPSRFRELLGDDASADRKAEDKIILTTGLDRCLVAYPKSTWDAFEERLATMSQFDPAVVKLKRIYVAPATECVIDKLGRVLIPPMLREYAKLERDLVWAGMVTTLELWAKEEWSKQSTIAREDPRAISQALKELGL
jgi:MraZ protein